MAVMLFARPAAVRGVALRGLSMSADRRGHVGEVVTSPSTSGITTERASVGFCSADMDLDSSVVFIPAAFGPASGGIFDLDTDEPIEILAVEWVGGVTAFAADVK